jgi:hypothetical protein
MTQTKLRYITKYPLWLLLEYIDYVDRCVLTKEMPFGFYDWMPLFTSDKDSEKVNSLPIPKIISD